MKSGGRELQIMSEATGTRPFSAFEWMLSMRYLRSRRREGFISFIAVISFLSLMIGVAGLIIVMAVMNGFRKELLDKILGLNGHMVIQPIDSALTDWDQVAARVSGVPGVRLAEPVVQGQALASSAFNANGVLVRGVRGADLAKLGSIGNNIKQGTLDGFDRGQGIVIGTRLANQLSLQVGDNLSLVSPRGAATPMGIMPRIKQYRVAAIFEIGMSEYDASIVFMPLAEAQAYFNRAGDVTAIEVFVDNPDRIDSYKKPIADAAQRPIYLIDWRQHNATFFRALQVERHVLSWLTSTELFDPNLYFLSRLPAEMDVGETTAVVVLALTLSFLATLYPCWRAARLDPVEALRSE